MSEVLIVNGTKIDPRLVKNLLSEVENNPDNKVLKSLINNKLDHETIKVLASKPEEKEGFSNLLYYCNKQYYHSILAEVFTKIFQYVGAKIPDEHLISELIINLNQAGYQGTLYHNVFAPSAAKCNL
ncbi:hypothetical protein [Candidatus Mesenet endosymbiont of Phosphuga atrata]|uniref:hypothetical protein n=1 Tax=Candidatus Mesenet endosymbiont of Phosphuga atrata TaxID=3066221 RepID=UPI0030CD81D1